MLYDVMSHDVVCCLHVGLSPLHCDPTEFNSSTKRQLQLLPAFGALIDLVGVGEGQGDLVSRLQPAASKQPTFWQHSLARVDIEQSMSGNK